MISHVDHKSVSHLLFNISMLNIQHSQQINMVNFVLNFKKNFQYTLKHKVEKWVNVLVGTSN